MAAPERSKISDEILLGFMSKMETAMTDVKNSVADINNSVHDLSSNHKVLEAKVENHIQNTFNNKMYIGIIIVLVGMIGGLIGYVWGSEKNNKYENHVKEIHSSN